MTPALPPPDSGRDPQQRQQSRERPRKDAGIPSADEILAMFLKLNGMVALNHFRRRKANVIHRNLRGILDFQAKRAESGQPGLHQQALADLCRSGAGPSGRRGRGGPGQRMGAVNDGAFALWVSQLPNPAS